MTSGADKAGDAARANGSGGGSSANAPSEGDHSPGGNAVPSGGNDASEGNASSEPSEGKAPEGAAPKRRPGRRPGFADTRGEILAAARQVFAEKGFDKATIRGIAREANVDPALVHHYFESKEGVFVAAMELPMEPSVVVPMLLEGPREEFGERMVRFVLTLVSDPDRRQPVFALLRTAMTNDRAVLMIREFILGAMLGKVAEGLGVSPLRIEAAFSQMFGIVIMRYVVRLEPLASAETEELVELLAPTIQRYADGV
ncbi:DNA-binding transcriptional regulator, AcrR family [Sinosporangium album]|uniref:DNA-binding transcriptional regulator, AcrR family n=1 Tax=Sinosporangium album TaxID=504805 RepID=A0A1G8L094_9ACTN|nr:TetR family transcriptional regulator [Sinosporangium album]SDI49144.1 DNA-binding transcriptional regulator, AcrR family [Sinosporangium album]